MIGCLGFSAVGEAYDAGSGSKILWDAVLAEMVQNLRLPWRRLCEPWTTAVTMSLKWIRNSEKRDEHKRKMLQKE